MQLSKYPLEIILNKTKKMIYFSQIDLIRLLKRALRRSNLPLYFTRGFKPHVKISLLSNFKVGTKSKVLVKFYFTEKITKRILKEKLSKELPEGLTIR